MEKDSTPGRRYAQKLLDSISKDTIREAAEAFQYAEQFESPEKEIELVNYIFQHTDILELEEEKELILH